MANNVAVTAGSGTTMATDDVGGVHYPLVKLAVGTEDSAVRLGHLEDAAHSSGDAGIMVLAVRNDSDTALAGTEGDYIPLSVDASGHLMVVGDFTMTGESHIGEVGGSSLTYTPSITVTAGAYSAGDVVGGRQTLTNAMRVSGGTGYLTDIIMTTADGELPEGTIFIFDSATASSIADNAAFAWGSGDHAKLLAKIPVVTADWSTHDSDGVAHLKGLGIGVWASGSQNLYAYFVCSGTPTFAATSDLTMRYKFMRD